tara:strand:+ start:320 stop:673 length:354 start_codon:yes stop_codon:yes gene_type:complete
MRKPVPLDVNLSHKQTSKYSFRRLYRQQQMDLVKAICDCSKEWFEDPNQPEWPDNQIDARIELKNYVTESLQIYEKKSKFFIPTSVWVWIASQVVTYVVKVLIELNWSEIEKARSEK